MRPKGGQSANSPANTIRSRHRGTVGLPNRRSSVATRRTSGWNPLSGLPCPPSVAPLTFDAGYAVKKKGGASYPAPKFGTISGLVQRVRTQTISQARPDTKTLTSNRYLSCPGVSHTTRTSQPRELGSSVNVNLYRRHLNAVRERLAGWLPNISRPISPSRSASTSARGCAWRERRSAEKADTGRSRQISSGPTAQLLTTRMSALSGQTVSARSLAARSHPLREGDELV